MSLARKGIAGVFLMTLGLAPLAGAAKPWPTLEFEVYEGAGRSFDSVGGSTIARGVGLQHWDTPRPASVPLSPELKREMERYLSEVAAEYQRLGFPPPALEPRVNRPDGKAAYRVYFFEFGQFDNFKGSEGSGAVTGYACKGEPNAKRISFNARIVGDNAAARAVAVSTGSVPGKLDKLTDKGYGDLAHELFHAVQRGTAFFDANCEPPKWITEGQAEAIGHDMAWKLRGVRSPGTAGQINRWGVRPYNQPLDTDRSRPMEVIESQGYATSSLWRYLAELEREAKSRNPSPSGPNAGPVTQRDAFDYAYLVRLLADASPVGNTPKALDWLDNWLEHDARLSRPLELVFPDFVTMFADYGRHRFVDQMPLPQRRDAFQNATLRGCTRIQIDLFGTSPPPAVELALPAIAARCLRIERTDTRTDPVMLDVRTALPLQDAQALHMGVAGTHGAVKASVTNSLEEAGNAIANWTVTLQPGESLDLVFSNIAETASASRFFEPELAFAISGWTAQGPPFDPSLAKPDAKRPRPRPRPSGGSINAAISEPVTHGPGAARLERELPEATTRRNCRGSYVDSAVRCGPTMTVVLRQLPRWMAEEDMHLDELEGGLALGDIESLVASRSADAISALGDLEVRLTLPVLAFGYQGAVDHALIHVSGGGWPESVSRGPRDVEPGTLTYFPASGRVFIEEYGPLVLRGRFQAQLVALPVPQSAKSGFHELPVLGALSGRFTVGQPWRGDARYEPEPPSLSEIKAGIAEMLPGILRDDPRFNPGKATDRGSNGALSGQPGRAGVVSECDCSCEGKASLLRKLEEFDEDYGNGPISSDQLAMAMCMLTCSHEYGKCP